MSDKTGEKGKTLRFKAEVAQLLDIVVNSLYTDKEIFVRELISNASDALEKMRRLALVEKDVLDKDAPLEIRITTDEENHTFTITDTGIGMNADEANQNLGTIAHSGSREFIKQAAEGEQLDFSLIGQFGVGFYSAFMVAEKVEVTTRSYRSDDEGILWTSTGAGTFTIKPREGLKRGTSITVYLKEKQYEYAKERTIKDLVKQYSNFVDFPIFIGDEQVNTVGALWTKTKSDITEEEYKEFYKFIANAFDEPMYTFHFNADAPLAIKSVLFVPGDNQEMLGLGRVEPGVSLYCKKVLIQQQAEELLPEYFRFIKGVIDSDDLPLNISRETMQDSALIAKIRQVMTGRLIKFLYEEASFDAEKYNDFFKKFGTFIKEGVYSDYDHRKELAKLLRYESSATKDQELTSLDDYVSRMKESQKDIYFISGPNREVIEAGPYLEAFQQAGFEVLYMYEGGDDIVMSGLREYADKKLVSADQADIDLPEEVKEETEDKEKKPEGLSKDDAGDLAKWMKEVLGDKISEVRISKRLVGSPAVLVNPSDHMTTGMQRVLQAAARNDFMFGTFHLEINPKHAIMQNLNKLRSEESVKEIAENAVWMLLDNATMAAGLMVDPKVMMERNTALLTTALERFGRDSEA